MIVTNYWERFRKILLAIAITIILAFLFLPLLSVFFSMTPATLLAKLNTKIAYQALFLSVETTTISLAVILILGTPLAYWLAKSQFKGNRLLRVLIQMPIVTPPAVAGVGLLLIFGRTGLLGHSLSVLGLSFAFNTPAVILAQIFISAPFFISSAMQAFEGVDDKLISVSRTLGISRWKTFWRVAAPMAMTGLLSGAALSWGRALGEFGATMMFAGNLPGKTQTLPLAIYTAMQSDPEVAIAMSALLLFVSFVLLLLVMLVGRESKEDTSLNKKEGNDGAVI